MSNETFSKKRVGWAVAVVFGVTALALTSPSPVLTVPDGNVAIIKRMGADVRVAGPGLVWKLPFLERADRMTTRTQIFQFPGIAARTQDGERLAPRLRMSYQLVRDHLIDLRANYDWDIVGKLLSPAVTTSVRAFVSKSIAADLHKTMGLELANAVKADLAKALPPGVTIQSISVESLEFTPEYEGFQRRLAAVVRDEEIEKVRLAEQDASQALRQQYRMKQLESEAALERQRALYEAQREIDAQKLKNDAEMEFARAQAKALTADPQLATSLLLGRWKGAASLETVQDQVKAKTPAR